MSTKIEWATETWNPVTGCTKISEGCQNCYAKRMANRLRGRYGYPADEPFRVTFHRDRIEQPLKWKKPRKIFVCSMGDLFHSGLTGWMINEVWMMIRNAPQHIFILLTKRPGAMKAWTRAAAQVKAWPVEEIWPENVWVGVTAENQKCADERIPTLLHIPAAVRFVSVEPMLGPVDLRHMDVEEYSHEWCFIDALTGKHTDMGRPCPAVPKLDWVICGGETGPGARPMKKEWVHDLRDQCVDAGVPFFFKKWGPGGRRDIDGEMWEQWPAQKPKQQL